MRWLVDNQLPPALAHFLTEQGEDAVHVRDCGLGAATDVEILRWAVEHAQAIVSKDSDFLDLALATPDAKLLWVRVGNCRRERLLEAFEDMLPEIRIRFSLGQRIVELR